MRYFQRTANCINRNMNLLGFVGSALVGLGTGIWWILDCRAVRMYRLKRFMDSDGSKFSLGPLPYVPQQHLVEDLCTSIEGEAAGVKILWSPAGAGKTTTTRNEFVELRSKGNISGLAILSPPDKNVQNPADWFRQHLTDFRGPILKEHEKLSTLLPCERYRNHPKFVFVFDQMDNAAFDENLKIFTKTMGEDSVACKTYVVIMICADPTKAASMWDWNGREKISMLSPTDNFRSYQWTEKEVKEWLGKHNRTEKMVEKVALQELAVRAGTPSYLVNALPNLNEKRKWSEQEPSLRERAAYYSSVWATGVSLLETEKNKHVTTDEQKCS